MVSINPSADFTPLVDGIMNNVIIFYVQRFIAADIVEKILQKWIDEKTNTGEIKTTMRKLVYKFPYMGYGVPYSTLDKVRKFASAEIGFASVWTVMLD